MKPSVRVRGLPEERSCADANGEVDSFDAARASGFQPPCSQIQEMFGTWSQPQWAMAAAAVIAGGQLPLFLTRTRLEASQTAANQPPKKVGRRDLARQFLPSGRRSSGSCVALKRENSDDKPRCWRRMHRRRAAPTGGRICSGR
jgi:hypothetical protein